MELEKVKEKQITPTIEDADVLKFLDDLALLKYDGQEAIELPISKESEKSKEESFIPQEEKSSESEFEIGKKFYGTIRTAVKITDGKYVGSTKNENLTGVWEVVSKTSKNMTVKNSKGDEFKTNPRTVERLDLQEKLEKQRAEAEVKKLQYSFQHIPTSNKLLTLVTAGIKNIWMCGKAGCGKSTMGKNLAKELGIDCLVISCGIGTSASTFEGYKYPTREATRFAEYYAKPSVIIIDEFTALDPAVAQVVNAALANGEIETTTGIVKRHSECIIIATSNTFGTGASRMYVANNQLDASTIDRFIGGIIEVDYDPIYESQFDTEVVTYVQMLRKVIDSNEIRRVASTRMIIEGEKLKKAHISDWKQLLIISWTKSEKELVTNFDNNTKLDWSTKICKN